VQWDEKVITGKTFIICRGEVAKKVSLDNLQPHLQDFANSYILANFIQKGTRNGDRIRKSK
jgi:hypothetical protein